ncbi:hypothetical protein D9619_013093 [Psilocybe cf. subviscida]|uniref:Uncharacterized protein n=1 Tax=Psilocybe cf. subviscida TaxID=2480587 RepID=A0A8H5AZG5_9AGAR|nr:hypothetical protein D9619_013093 [Psilocybe cf. subviscida]
MATKQFDPHHTLVSSYLIPPSALGAIRLLIAVYVLAGLIFMLVWGGVKTKDLDSFFSYFTNLGYIGICAYFFASGTQTLAYARNLRILAGLGAMEPTAEEVRYPLQKAPRFLRYLYVLLLSTVITFPILVTVVYWTLIASSSSFSSAYITWSNVTKHILNSVFALFEILLTNTTPMPWIDLPATLVMLIGYLGVAYITHQTQGFYTYSFLDPGKSGKKKLAAYIVGIAVGQCVTFCVVRLVISIRSRVVRKRVEAEETRGGAISY